MKVYGASELNANNYRKISIHKNINVMGTSYKDRIKVSDGFTKSLKGKTDDEKIEEVVRYFLRNHKIAMLYEDRNEIIIQSQSEIDLIISKMHALSKELIKEIMNKYSIDRMDAYADSDVDFYWIMSKSLFSSTEMSYSVGVVDDFQHSLKAS